jgi:hypothetical protein
MISSTGQIGVKTSWERYKKDITPMGSNSEKLQRLRPVTFHYKSDTTGNLEYGQIAEEVAKVYPEFVIRNAAGRIDGVRYDELAPLLLKEVQQQQKEIRALKLQQQTVLELQRQMAEMRAGMPRLQSKDELAAKP